MSCWVDDVSKHPKIYEDYDTKYDNENGDDDNDDNEKYEDNENDNGNWTSSKSAEPRQKNPASLQETPNLLTNADRRP